MANLPAAFSLQLAHTGTDDSIACVVFAKVTLLNSICTNNGMVYGTSIEILFN